MTRVKTSHTHWLRLLCAKSDVGIPPQTLWCFCPRTFFSNDGSDLPWISFVSNMTGLQTGSPIVFGSFNSFPHACCVMTQFEFTWIAFWYIYISFVSGCQGHQGWLSVGDDIWYFGAIHHQRGANGPINIVQYVIDSNKTRPLPIRPNKSRRYSLSLRPCYTKGGWYRACWN